MPIQGKESFVLGRTPSHHDQLTVCAMPGRFCVCPAARLTALYVGTAIVRIGPRFSEKDFSSDSAGTRISLISSSSDGPSGAKERDRSKSLPRRDFQASG